MADKAIRIDDLGKRYRIGESAASYETIRETMMRKARAPFNKAKGLIRGQEYGAAGLEKEIWALRHIDLEITKGETLGIIGHNGAGKTTILRIISNITKPTEGRVEILGKVGSLLEVGTGMHPELTGRENIFLNGAIIGMTKKEIERKFDEIVEFSGIGEFVDTPLKHYSSGMQVRLAFSVASHVNPEILLIDEVLAVGDAEFQKKCLGKMGEVASLGRTVIFVSHNMQAISSLCNRVIELKKGELIQDTSPDEAIENYLNRNQQSSIAQRDWMDLESRPGDDELSLLSIRVVEDGGRASGTFLSNRQIVVEMEFELNYLHSALCVGFDLLDRSGTLIFRTYHSDGKEEEWPELVLGRNRLRCYLPRDLLNGASYFILPAAILHYIKWIIKPNIENAISFNVSLTHGESPFWIAPQEGVDTGTRPGVIAPVITWESVQ